MKSWRATAPSPRCCVGAHGSAHAEPWYSSTARAMGGASRRPELDKQSLGCTKLQMSDCGVRLDLRISILKATRPANAMGTIVQTRVFSIGSYFYTCWVDLVILQTPWFVVPDHSNLECLIRCTGKFQSRFQEQILKQICIVTSLRCSWNIRS